MQEGGCFFSSLTPVASSTNMRGFARGWVDIISFFYLLFFFAYDIIAAGSGGLQPLCQPAHLF